MKFQEDLIYDRWWKTKTALFRYGIIAPAISGLDETSTSLQGFFRDASTKVYKNLRGEDTKVAASTIEKWFYYYNVGGFDALLPKRRSDTGIQSQRTSKKYMS